jgi:murein DD-endopeptidase MepM/ murein hydrolase activator NlpD
MKNFLKKYITDRKLVVISDHNVKSITVPAKLQFALILIVLGACAWLPFSMGRVAAYTDISYENAHIINESTDVEQRLYLMERNIDVLEHYLNKLYKDGKFFISQPIEEPKNNTEKMVMLDNRKNKIISYLATYTQNKTTDIEKILKDSGVNYKKIIANNGGSAAAQGGPYIPSSLGKTAEESLANYTQYFNNNFVGDFEYLITLQNIVSELPFSSPVQTPKVTSGYGYRRDPMRGGHAMHSGIDLVGRANAAVHATAPGIVKKAGRSGAYGNIIVIQHKNGVETVYAHLKRVYVKAGQKIGRGNVIGVQGSTGRSTGAHLHYEVRLNGKATNPMRFLRYADKVNFYEVKL